MIIVNLNGGLGNQMFQYALGRSLAVKTGQRLFFDTATFKNDKLREYSLSPFKISAVKLPEQIAFIFRYLAKNNIAGFKDISQPFGDLKFNKNILNLEGSLYLDGYWQCEKYFIGIRKTLQKDFELKSGFNSKVNDLVDKIESENSVCLHVRRGDFFNDSKVKESHGVCDKNYYLKSVKYIAKRVKSPVFFVFSDDIEWAKKNLIIKNAVFISGYSPEIDFTLMKGCRHYIISNSSFSWWAAWLSNSKEKIVCAPSKWYLDRSEGDTVPKSWVRIK